MREKRERKRILAFCKVLDLERNWIGVSFDITSEGIRLSLPSTFAKDGDFTVILKRNESKQALEVTITVRPIWHRSSHHLYDEIGGKIVAVENKKEFQAFLTTVWSAVLWALVNK